jgi:PDZ domain-containing protein
MLLNGGELDGVRILSSQAVSRMTTNALPSDIRIYGGDEVGVRSGATFGLGFAIRTNPVFSWIPGAPGSFSWAGSWGTWFWVDPAEKLIAVQMIQATPASKAREAVAFAGISRLAYGALTVPGRSSFVPKELSPEALADYVGTYDFGSSVSSRDRQGLADGKSGSLGIEAFVAMEQEGLRINRPNPDSPAAGAGVMAGDLVTELDDVPLKGLSLASVLAKLRGAVNTAVKLKIVRKGQSGGSVLSVVRADRRVNAVRLQLRVEQGKLVADATGAWPLLEFEQGKATPLLPISDNEFVVDDEDHTRLAFVRDAPGNVSGLILNPGPWEQKAATIAPGSYGP